MPAFFTWKTQSLSAGGGEEEEEEIRKTSTGEEREGEKKTEVELRKSE